MDIKILKLLAITVVYSTCIRRTTTIHRDRKANIMNNLKCINYSKFFLCGGGGITCVFIK